MENQEKGTNVQGRMGTRARAYGIVLAALLMLAPVAAGAQDPTGPAGVRPERVADARAAADTVRPRGPAERGPSVDGDGAAPADSTLMALEALEARVAELMARLEDVEEASQGPELQFTGRVHAQMATSSVSDQIGAAFLIRRARVTAVLKLNDLISGKIQPEFAGGSVHLQDAYLSLAFDPALRVTVGQFKRAFDLFSLTSSTRSLVIETEGRVAGVNTCAGPGGICSYGRLSEKLAYAKRDVGVGFDGRVPGTPLSYRASITNGSGANTLETNGAKSYRLRLAYDLAGDLTVAANGALHDYEDGTPERTAYARAIGADLEWGTYDAGWHVQAGALTGDNWLSRVNGVPVTFRTAQAIVAYKAPVEMRWFSAFEPLARVSWADPDGRAAGDQEWFTTLGLQAHLLGRNKIAANLERWSPHLGEPEWSLKVQTYLHF